MMKIEMTPIGFVHGGADYPQQSPRQSVWAKNEGTVVLEPGFNFETALADLEGFSRIWIVFLFDRARSWKPKVHPPWGAHRRIGVFATRSPHRPNPVGISAVELIRISGRTLYIRNFDLLEGTPVLDIKPYIPEADSFPDSQIGWRGSVPEPPEFCITPEAAEEAMLLLALGGPDLADVSRVQLCCHDLDPKTQRLTLNADGTGTLAWRTWRIDFIRQEGVITVTAFRSGYTPEELAPGVPDPYGDKAVHRAFAGHV